ncbi:MAG: VWA domain-containing protein [bacterium]|nr:VWA domain-containing protein [bacterium]
MKTHITKVLRGVSLSAVLLASSLAVAQQPSTTHDAVVIVLDDSGSMDEGMSFGGPNKMTAAKDALKMVLRSIPGTTWVGLLTLNGGWKYDLGPRNDARLLDVISGVQTKGSTPLARSIKAGADRLMQEREKQLGYGHYRLLVVTDGQESEDNRGIEAYPPEVRARGLTLDVIGVAMGEDHVLAKHAHTYRNAADPSSLERVIREVFAERVDPNDRTGGGDAFELIAGLDPGVAQEALLALGRAGNHPIGEQPPAPPTEDGSSADVPLAVGSTAPTSGCSGCQTADGKISPFIAFWSVVAAFAIGFIRRRQRARVPVTRR